MALVTPEELISASPVLRKLGGRTLARLILRILKIDRLNTFYDTIHHAEPEKGLNTIIDYFGFKYEVSETDLKRIPRTGAYITVSNHPLGGPEGVILARLMLNIRPDFKIITNFLLSRIAPLSGWFIPVNPFESHKNSKSSFSGIKEALGQLSDGKPLCIFPAGEVSAYQKKWKTITDKEWQPSIMKIVQRANVPVIPIYFEGKNSLWFYILGLINPLLRTIRLPAEFQNKHNKPLKIRIGSPINIAEQSDFSQLSDYTRFLRNKTYALGIPYHEKDIQNTQILTPEEKIIEAIPIEVLMAEIATLQEHYLFSIKNYSVYAPPSSFIPKMMQEIARYREITYREVGEGTNKALDTDKYDAYFYQLFIWDEEAKRLVGAYRIGPGREILSKYGLEGFYIHSLFKLDEKLKPVLNETLELGRSFVVKEYQRKATPLYLLWKALLVLLLKFEYRYLIGPVSISGRFSNIAKALTIEFLAANYYQNDLAGYIKNREKSEIKLHKVIDRELFLQVTKGDFAKLDKYIQDIDPNFTTPILVRQYVSMLNTKTIGFNVDPMFNNCLDALMIMDIRNAPKALMESLAKDLKDAPNLEKILNEVESRAH
ncbi:MAG: hemolysin [Bacteroidetes bacterium HGW-Bacteroidetes-22]|nr:MAG: hemolysin [Bacteroidetes bacterium HGW-Bacteroidetes-22]